MHFDRTLVFVLSVFWKALKLPVDENGIFLRVSVFYLQCANEAPSSLSQNETISFEHKILIVS